MIQQGELRGAEVFALDLSSTLARDGVWDVTLMSLFGVEHAYTAAAAAAGVGIAVVQPNGRASGFDVRLVRKVQAAIDAGGYQVVQANGAATLKYLVAARRLARRPWRLVYRAIGMGSYWRRGFSRRLVYRWLLGQPDRIVAVCGAVADDLVAAAGLNPARVTIVPNGVEPSRIASTPEDRPRLRTALGVRPSETLLVYIGSLAPEKNLGALVAVVARCRQEGLPVKALVVGDGPSRDDLRDLVRHHAVEEAILFQSAQDVIGPHLAAADLCVLPSLSEGMPALLIEAGLAGLPAVAYALGGIPEVIEHDVTGLLVGAGDQPALTRAVATLVTDGGRRRALGEAARVRYRRFDIAVVARAYSAVYQALLDGQRAA